MNTCSCSPIASVKLDDRAAVNGRRCSPVCRRVQPGGHVKGADRNDAELDLTRELAIRMHGVWVDQNHLLIAALQNNRWRGAQLNRDGCVKTLQALNLQRDLAALAARERCSWRA